MQEFPPEARVDGCGHGSDALGWPISPAATVRHFRPELSPPRQIVQCGHHDASSSWPRTANHTLRAAGPHAAGARSPILAIALVVKSRGCSSAGAKPQHLQIDGRIPEIQQLVCRQCCRQMGDSSFNSHRDPNANAAPHIGDSYLLQGTRA